MAQKSEVFWTGSGTGQCVPSTLAGTTFTGAFVDSLVAWWIGSRVNIVNTSSKLLSAMTGQASENTNMCIYPHGWGQLGVRLALDGASIC